MLNIFTKTSSLAVQPSEPRSQINRHHELSISRHQPVLLLLNITDRVLHCCPYRHIRHTGSSFWNKNLTKIALRPISFVIVLNRKQCFKINNKINRHAKERLHVFYLSFKKLCCTDSTCHTFTTWMFAHDFRAFVLCTLTFIKQGHVTFCQPKLTTFLH